MRIPIRACATWTAAWCSSALAASLADSESTSTEEPSARVAPDESTWAANFTECTVTVSTEQEAAADAAFAAMDPDFQEGFDNAGGSTDFSQCFNYNNLRFWIRDYWFPFAWAAGNPATFALATSTPAAAPIVIEPTFTG